MKDKERRKLSEEGRYQEPDTDEEKEEGKDVDSEELLDELEEEMED